MMGWLGHKAIISQGRSVLPLDMAPSFLKFLPTTSVDLQASPDRKFLTSDPCIWIICHMPEHEKITGPWYTYIFLQKYLSFVHCMKELRTKSVYPSAKSCCLQSLLWLPGEAQGQRSRQATVHGVTKSLTWLRDGAHTQSPWINV